MNKKIVKTAAACGLCLTLLASASFAGAAYTTSARNQTNPAFSQMQEQFGGMMGGMMQQNVQYAGEAGEIVTGMTTNSAASLTADYLNATTITMSDENSAVKIKEAGTYIVTGSCADGNITVTKGTTGVVLVLKDLDLTSTIGATLSINKGAEAKIVVSGSVTLTDAEDASLEDVSEDFDGAAIKVKSGASAYLTGTGTLTINGSAKNGVKVSASEDDGNGSLVIDGATVNITAANDAINAEYDLAILSGTLTVSAGDDALHADRVLTIGADGNGPTITVKTCTEGVEATVVNIAGGTVNVTSTDDGLNAANSDGAYASLGYSINVTGGSVTVNAPRADGFDSNGNINLIAGSATIQSASNGGDAGLDYDGQLYVSDEFELNNQSGVTSMGAMGGGRMGGTMQQPDQQQDQQTQERNNQRGNTQQTPMQNDQQGNTQQTPAQGPRFGGAPCGRMPMQGADQNRQPGGMRGGFGNRMGGMLNGGMCR